MPSWKLPLHAPKAFVMSGTVHTFIRDADNNVVARVDVRGEGQEQVDECNERAHVLVAACNATAAQTKLRDVIRAEVQTYIGNQAELYPDFWVDGPTWDDEADELVDGLFAAVVGALDLDADVPDIFAEED